MLAETVDTELWEAQRVLQSASTDAVNLSGCDALSRALDAAAGETDAAPSGDESLLIDRIDDEYLKYFTATGRPTGAWKSAIDRVKAAEAEVRSLAARRRGGQRAGVPPRGADRGAARPRGVARPRRPSG